MLTAALLILVPTAFVVSSLQELALDLTPDTSLGTWLFRVILIGFLAVGGSFGSVFYAGLLDKLVGHQHHGHPRLTILEVLRSLPYLRLFAANLVVVAATLIGVLLFIVPGIVGLTLLAIVGPVITIQDYPLTQALRTSVRLVRPVFWLVLLLVTLPVAFEQVLHEYVNHLLLTSSALARALILDGLLVATVGAIVGLIEVTLAYDLLARSGELRRHVSDVPSRAQPEPAAT
ncbi:MAG TPA: hypothetical protein VFO84_10755 [Dehalococcoidia bacterium]|nr:hypothetical protein [Dehalococcoidia bacterium]